MDKHQIQEFMSKLHIFHSVYELQPLDVSAGKTVHQLQLIEDFESDEAALAFIMQNSGSFHSLTVIKRYE